MKRLLLITTMLAWTGLVHAQLNVVATTANMGMLARTVGGDAVRVTVLAPPDRDPHYLEARPQMLAALRRADLLVAVGAGLEVGWLPAAIAGSHNDRVRLGTPGHFEAAQFVELIETDVEADRAGGDVHPGGNPHFYLDPVRFAQAASALAHRMAELDASNADAFRQAADAFAAEVGRRMPGWAARLEAAPPVVAYHKDVNYLLERFDIPVVGYIEPLPGIPPTARHLSDLVTRLRGTDGVIVHLPFQPADGPQFLHRELGWPVVRQSGNVSTRGGAAEYFALLDGWVSGIGGHG